MSSDGSLSGVNRRRAFTLIELLVVTTILGCDTAGTKNNGEGLQFDPLEDDKDDYVQNCGGGAAVSSIVESGPTICRVELAAGSAVSGAKSL